MITQVIDGMSRYVQTYWQNYEHGISIRKLSSKFSKPDAERRQIYKAFFIGTLEAVVITRTYLA